MLQPSKTLQKPHLNEEVDKLARAHLREIRTIRSLENMASQLRVKKLGFFSLEKRRQRERGALKAFKCSNKNLQL